MRKFALLVGLSLVLAGCGSLARLQDLSEELSAEGYEVIGVNHNSSPSGSLLSVELVDKGELPTEDDAVAVAEIVWNEFDGDFDRLKVAINAQPMLAATEGELAERFGERPAGLADGDEKGDGMNVTALVIILAVAAAFAGLMVLLWRRGRRSTPPVAPPGPYAPGHGPNYANNPYAGPPPPPRQ
jgi:hypothetical protein